MNTETKIVMNWLIGEQSKNIMAITTSIFISNPYDEALDMLEVATKLFTRNWKRKSKSLHNAMMNRTYRKVNYRSIAEALIELKGA